MIDWVIIIHFRILIIFSMFYMFLYLQLVFLVASKLLRIALLGFLVSMDACAYFTILFIFSMSYQVDSVLLPYLMPVDSLKIA